MDSSKGFGIRYAIITGHLAAKAIIEGDDYDKLWKKEIKNEIERNFKRRLWLNKLTNMDYDEMLKRMGNEVNIEKYLKETRQNKRHIDLLFPLYLMKWRIARSFS
jgi:flavin-dependent dehydrogenase